MTGFQVMMRWKNMSMRILTRIRIIGVTLLHQSAMAQIIRSASRQHGETESPGSLYGVGVFCVFEMTNTMLSGVGSAVMPPVAAHVFGGTCVATTTPAAPFADMVTPGITTL